MPERFDAAYNLARWLVGNPADAEDIVQEAFLRALRFFDGFRGGDSRAWLLKIVGNTSYSWMRKNRPAQLADQFDESIHSDEAAADNAESKLLSRAESERVSKALEALPLTFREVLVLREIEGLSYKEISRGDRHRHGNRDVEPVSGSPKTARSTWYRGGKGGPVLLSTN